MKQLLILILAGIMIFAPAQLDAQRKIKKQTQKAAQTTAVADSTKKQPEF